MSERVQLNLSILAKEKLALQALAEGRGVSVTRLVLSLVYGGVVGPVPGPPVLAASEPASVAETRGGLVAGAPNSVTSKTRTPSHGSDRPVGGSQSISDPGEVPAAVERVAAQREFTPFSKERQAGRRPKEKK